MTAGTRVGCNTTCPDCGNATIAVQLPYLSTPIQLEDHDVPVTADLTGLVRALQVWEYAGPRVGWIEKYSDRRTWRPLRARHDCPQQRLDDRTATRRPGKHKHESENQP